MDTLLREWRYNQRLSPESAAKLFGISVSHYQKWESGKSSVPLRFYIKISSITGEDISNFLPEGLTILIKDEKTDQSVFQYKALKLVKLLEENYRKLHQENELLRAEIERLCYH